MFKQFLKLEVRGQEDRIIQLSIDPTTPLGELYDALSIMKKCVYDQIKAQEDKAAEEKKGEQECCSSECEQSEDPKEE